MNELLSIKVIIKLFIMSICLEIIFQFTYHLSVLVVRIIMFNNHRTIEKNN